MADDRRNAVPPKVESRRLEALPAVQRYVEKRLCRLFDWNQASIRIRIPSSGTRSRVFFVSVDGRDSVTVRAFRTAAHRTRLRRALSLADHYDLPVPKLLNAGYGPLERALFGFSFLTTEFIRGDELPPCVPDSDRCTGLAAALAQIHRAGGRRWGKPGHYRRTSIRDRWRRSVESRLDRLTGSNGELDPTLIEDLRRWFEARLAAIPEPREFQICHHHLAPDDILYEETSGRVTFVDCSSLQFSRGARDLAAIRYTLYLGQDGPWEEFLQRYFAHFPSGAMEETAEERRFFDAFTHLLRLARRLTDAPAHQAALEQLLRATSLV